MKRKFIPILLCLCIGLTCSLFGCGGEKFSEIKVSGKQDTSYTVQSQGGMAVQYGNYVYFINGYAGYEDTKGKNNNWPNVVKGGLYRAELRGTKEGSDFIITPDVSDNVVTAGLEFKSTKGTDYDGNDIDVVSVQKIAPKKIGTSGYKEGGIFIFDEWVYFASPNNEKNKQGVVQVTKTDFFRARLDGKDVQKIYTTANDGAEAAPYAFYKFKGSVYLVAQDGTNLISVKVGKKPGNKVTIAKNITSVVLPYSETYYKGINENTLDSFVYVQRAVGDKDTQKSGNVIEIMRPDGSEGGVYLSQGKTDTLEAVRDGMLFYRTSNDSGQTLINYDNLHNFLMERSPSYKAYQKKIAGYAENGNDAQLDEYRRNVREQLSGTVFATSSIGDITSTYCFRPAGEQSNLVYALAFKSGSVDLYNNLTQSVTVYNASCTLLTVAEEYMYFTDSGANVVYRTAWDKAVADKESDEVKEQVSHDSVTATTFNGDYCAGYIVYAGKVDDWADGYTFFKKVDRAVGSKPVFVGTRISGDVKPDDADDEE